MQEGRARRLRPPGLGRLTAIGCAVTLLALAVASPARAQSDADKAAARQLATDGIVLYRAGKYAEALDKLERAEALYDAPVHLLYIARCQAQVGKLVESAETYRKLVRLELDPSASQPFKDAQAAAGPELEKLTPRIPALRLELTPARVEGLAITIDGVPVPAAILGVDRPSNPGEHRVELRAPGYAAVSETVTLAEGDKKKLPLRLVQSSTTEPSVAPASAPAGPKSRPGQPRPAASPSGGSSSSSSGFGYMLGLRLGASVPSGELATLGPARTTVKLADVAKAGAGVELHGGVRFAKYFTPVFIIAGSALPPGPSFDNLGDLAGVNATTTVSHTTAGLGVLVGTPRGKLGFFGELDFMLLDSLSAETEYSPGDCTEKSTFTGNSFRLGGGVVVPVASYLHLTPVLTAQFGSYREFTHEASGAGCAPYGVKSQSYEFKDSDRGLHTLVFLGVGGDFVFGGDKSSK